MTLTNILEKNAKELGNQTALVMKMGYRTVSLSYGDVYEWSKKVAVFLERQGLQREDKVLILAPNSPYWICLWWGALLGGYVPVPLTIQSTRELVGKIAQQTEAKIIFKNVHYKQELPQGLYGYDIEFLKELVIDVDARDFQKPESDEDDAAELMYTSGTTGDPKGVMLTHKNIISNLEAIQKVASTNTNDRFLSILPLSHIFEQIVGFLLPFSKGITIFYAHSPAAIRDLLKEHRITIMAAVPEFLRIVMTKIESRAEEEGKKKIFAALLALSGALKIKAFQRLVFGPVLKQFGGRLHTVVSGGAPLDPELEKKWEALGVYLLQGYGLTETSPVVSTNDYEDRRIGSVGKIIPRVKVKIAEDGEIWVKGPNVFQGYFKNEAKTKESFSLDGWFMTGDIGEIDSDRFLYIRGRKKYMIKGPGAQNVYPEDIEIELNKIAGVKDNAVVGLEKPGGQVEIHAVLLGEDLKDPEKIIREANKNLASYQQITGWSIWPREDFPRSATRKIKKEEVLRLLKDSKIPAPSELVTTPLARLLAEITSHDASEISQKTKIVSELHLDSLLRIELVARIEEKFEVAIDEYTITPETTVADLEDMVQKGKAIAQHLPLKKWPRSWWTKMARRIVQAFIFYPLAKIFMKLRVEGGENLRDLPLPSIFMPNHISYLDFLVVLMALPAKIRKRVAFAAARDVLFEKYKYLAGWGELFFNAFPFPRQEYENIKVGLEYMGQLLDQGWSIVVFPEGRVSVDAQLQPLKRGAGLMAVEMDVPVVPVFIRGTEYVMPYGKFFPRKRGIVRVKFGQPVKFKKSDSYIEATEKLEGVLKEL